MVDIMTGSGINSGKDSYVGYDPTTNLIYWKDDLNKSDDMLKYLAWLDRPIPMANLSFTVYEVRDSILRDLGIDYLGWRNGRASTSFRQAWTRCRSPQAAAARSMRPAALSADSFSRRSSTPVSSGFSSRTVWRTSRTPRA